ncbi:similar to Saccharomyces cerevisiae YDR108W TRS85 Subunit of TRAPPIII (transport protein particle) [Maudiozyma saulgeensis]|uniref:Similar to Saccharomyces cerevisiae YDR108W TRS85 Subunit of TRAPPIII (Transport protein particle) n=1 Tax=Maudiozyma saulgeensis TaxID=1789683 RepID=A0A1X7R643_9SACH|nr:similar to Saccharomyces cerevisiae YDR108W TRS85 Subunit of TRAPPIII (transport protein particle) [Kazachstania saulgeensis]
MKNFTYEHYMNLLFHLDYCNENVIPEISRRILLHAISPVITVTSTPVLDEHISEVYHIDSLYMMLRFFGGCVSDRDQVNEYTNINGTSNEDQTSEQSTMVNTKEDQTNDQETNNDTVTPKNTSNLTVPNNNNKRRNRSRSNSLFQRDATQSQYIRFTKPLADLLNTRETNDMLFDYHSLEIFLENYLKMIEKHTTDATPDQLLKKSLYHTFFSLAISSTTSLSPYESFNHPIVSLIALDISRGQTYEHGRDLLINFKNLHRNIQNFPAFINTNDILPVFLLCFDPTSIEQIELCSALTKQFKKQLFVETIALPLWMPQTEATTQVKLHQPVMSSLDEMIYFTQMEKETKLPLKLLHSVYDILDELVHDLLLPFMHRKISFWEDSVMQPRRSLFHGSKWMKKFISKNTHQQANTLVKDANGNMYFASSSTEFLLRKLADWSMMTSNFKNAYTTYESLSHELEDYPKYMATCLEWEAITLLMGAQSIVTVKMIKNDIVPLLDNALDTYDMSSMRAQKREDGGGSSVEPFRSYETRCMILAAELFLSLSDTWTSTPYAIEYLELILSECKLGPCSQIMIWERLSDCYSLRLDPRIRHKVENDNSRKAKLKLQREETSETEKGNHADTSNYDLVAQGLTRKRKAAFFRLLAAKKWADKKQWRQVAWCLNDIEDDYVGLSLTTRKNLILYKLREQLSNYEQNINEETTH